MPVVEADNALVTLPQAKVFLGLRGNGQDEDIQVLINRASDFCEGPNGAGRPLTRRAFTSLRLPLPSSCILWAPLAPIDRGEDLALTLYGVEQTVWTGEGDGDQADFDVVLRSSVPGHRLCPDQFWRAGGWPWADQGVQLWGWGVADPIVLSYTGGLAEVPGDLEHAALLVVQALYRHGQQLTDVSQVSASVSGSVSYALPTLVPMFAKQTLESYRVANI